MDDGTNTATTTVTVQVTDIPDETPVISAPTNMQTIPFNENDEVTGTLAISITGTDADAGETMSFALVTNPSSLFDLTPVFTTNTAAEVTLGLAGGNTLDFESGTTTYGIEVS